MEYSIVRILVIFAMLGLASYFDLKTRRIPDWIWIVFGVITVLIFIADLVPFADLLLVLISITMTGAISVAAYKFGLFGGADVFALVLLSALVPLHSANDYFHFTGIDNPKLALPIFDVLLNALVVSMSQIIYNVLHNTIFLMRNSSKSLFEGFEHESRIRKIMAIALSQKTSRASSKFGFTVEKTVGGTKYFDFSIKNAEHQTLTYEYSQNEEDNTMWVSAALPFLVFILSGFILHVLGIDIISLIFNIVVG